MTVFPRSQLGRASHSHFSTGKENLSSGMPYADVNVPPVHLHVPNKAGSGHEALGGQGNGGGTKINLGDGKAIVIRIENVSS